MTRCKRSQGVKPIRKIIENSLIPLPTNWNSFVAHPNNKTDLARFVSEQLLHQAPMNKDIVIAGSFAEETTVKSKTTIHTSSLEANHEEADTRIILHCMHTDAHNVVVSARDTDVLVFLVAHFRYARSYG